MAHASVCACRRWWNCDAWNLGKHLCPIQRFQSPSAREEMTRKSLCGAVEAFKLQSFNAAKDNNARPQIYATKNQMSGGARAWISFFCLWRLQSSTSISTVRHKKIPHSGLGALQWGLQVRAVWPIYRGWCRSYCFGIFQSSSHRCWCLENQDLQLLDYQFG